MTDEKKQQYTLKISQASRTQLVVILYEMTLDYLKEAEDAAGSRDEAAFHTGIKRARACIHELSHSLNHEYPVSGNRVFMIQRVAQFVNTCPCPFDTGMKGCLIPAASRIFCFLQIIQCHFI